MTTRRVAETGQADAEGVAEAFADATGDQLATKADLREQTADLRAEIAGLGAALRAECAPFKADMLLLKWMMGFVLALLAAILGHMLLR